MFRMQPNLMRVCAAILTATALCSASAYAGGSTTNDAVLHDRLGHSVHERFGNPVHHRFGDRVQASASVVETTAAPLK
jgi:hypothetical protein